MSRIQRVLYIFFIPIFMVTSLPASIGLTFHQAYFYVVHSTLQQEGYRLSDHGRNQIYKRMRSELLPQAKRDDGLFDHPSLREHIADGVLALHEAGHHSPEPEGEHSITAEECFDCFRFKSLVTKIPWEHYLDIIAKDLEHPRISMERLGALDAQVNKMENTILGKTT